MAASSRNRKHFIRNPSIPVKNCEENLKKNKKVHFSERAATGNEIRECSSLLIPEFSTVLQLTKAVADLRNSTHGFECSYEGGKYKNVNFTPEEKLFQDLIDVSLKDENSKKEYKSQSNCKHFLKKDSEPNYENLLKYNLSPSYVFSNLFKPSVTAGIDKTNFNGFTFHDDFINWMKT